MADNISDLDARGESTGNPRSDSITGAEDSNKIRDSRGMKNDANEANAVADTIKQSADCHASADDGMSGTVTSSLRYDSLIIACNPSA